MLKLVIVGPGIMPIPPYGWGAVENLIWDTKCFIERYHSDKLEVVIVNTNDMASIISQTNNAQPDIVHIQYDNHAHIVPYLNCKTVFITSHYGYIDQINKRGWSGYADVLRSFVNNRARIIALAPKAVDVYKKCGMPDERLRLVTNGANDDMFRYTASPRFPGKSVYVGKIEYRKRQYVYQNIPNVDFVGNYYDSPFNLHNPCYCGEWTRQQLYNDLTDYANLLLLSDGELHPLVCCEALVAGLGLVVSEFAAANLDTTLPFIDVIPESRLDDVEYVASIVQKNREVSISMRDTIRKYGVHTFGWRNVINKYVATITEAYNMDNPQTFGCYFQCCKNPYATYKALESFRRFYPTNTVVLLSDNGYDYSAMAQHFNCKYLHEHDSVRLVHEDLHTRLLHGRRIVKRLQKVFSLIPEKFVFWLEDDVIVNRPITDTFKYTINGYCPNKIQAQWCMLLREKHGSPAPGKEYVYSGHGGSVFHKHDMLKAFTHDVVIDDILENWIVRGFPTTIGCDFFISVLATVCGYEIGSYEGHGDCDSHVDPNLAVQHQYKVHYNTPMPQHLAHLVKTDG